jgi:peptidyl-prolyl cis-trans isomerase D
MIGDQSRRHKMFEAIYKKRKNPVFNIAGWVLLVLVCLIFMFVGYSPDIDFMGAGSSVAQVNGETISYAEFSRYLERVEESRKTGKMSNEERSKLNKEVVDSLVNRTLIIQAAKEQGVVIGAEEIRDFLKQIPQFQEKGVFSILRYKELLRAQGYSEARFEEQIAQDLIVQKMNQFYQTSTADNKLVEQQEDEISKIQLNLQFIRKAPQELVSDSDITDQEVQNFLSTQMKKVQSDYDLNIGKYTQKDSVRAQHILIKITPEMDDAKALAKIQEIAAQTKKENFSDMAKKWSQDSGSQLAGGDLGVFERGRMVKEFDEVVFSQPVGEISKPVKTSFGYHLILVNEKVPAKTKTFDEVKTQIAKDLLKQEKKSVVVKQINEQLQAGTIDAFLQKKGWVWEETGSFGLGDMMIPKLGDNNEVLTAALTLSAQSPVYKNVIEKDGFYYLVKLKSLAAENKLAQKKETNTDFFKQIFERQKSFEMFQGWMDHLRKTASIKINEKVISQ